ncbi:hypothetical protein, partial [Mycobacterium tuberculosis]
MSKEKELQLARSEIEALRTTIEELMDSEEKLNQEIEAIGERNIALEKVLLQLTDGFKLDYEIIVPDKKGAVVFVRDAPNDYYEREATLSKLGVAFADYDSVTFWYDNNQARLFSEGKLERNEDELVPPYKGMFGEIIKSEPFQQLILHGSTGGPLNLVFGKYQLP